MPANTIPFLLRKNFSSFTVTVPFDGANHQLLALMVALDKNCAVHTKYLTLEVDTASAGTLLVGEGPTDDQGAANPAVLTATNFGRSIPATVGYNTEDFGGIWDEAFPISRLWLRAATGAVTLHVQALRG